MTVTAPLDAELVLVNQPRTLWRGTRKDLRELRAHRELLQALVARDLRSRYKGSTLGWAWALVRPLVMLLVYGLAVGVFLGASRNIPQFMLFVYSGLIAWGLFAAIVNGAIGSLINNGQLVAKASFPRLLLPLSATLAALVDFALQASVLLVGYAIVGDLPALTAVLWVPLALLLLVLTALGVGLIVAAANVYIRDISFLTDVGLQVGFWLVPVVYSYNQILTGLQSVGVASETLSRIYLLNPMANVVLAFQRGLWPPASGPDADVFAFPGRLELRLALFTVAALALAWIGARVFNRLSGNFGQEL